MNERNSKNPSVHESVTYLIKKAKQNGLPINLVLATAYQESEFLQYNQSGGTFEDGGGYGIMQIQLVYWRKVYDEEKILNDWHYNVNVGIKILSDAYIKAEQITGYSGEDLVRSAYVLYNGGIGSNPDRWKTYFKPNPANDPNFKDKLDRVNRSFK